MKSFKRSAHSWYKKQLGHIKKFLLFKGDQLVHTISTADIIEYKTWLLNQYANKTSRDYLLTLKEFFDWCKIKAYLGMHPYNARINVQGLYGNPMETPSLMCISFRSLSMSLGC